MKGSDNHLEIKKVTFAGLLVALGIVYGDIGTSPLYTVKAIVSSSTGDFGELLIYGSLSCVFWTLTLQTTVKYIFITLRADNKGEGGIFALFALIRRKSAWVAILTMIGGATLLADGVITPAITVTSSIEGLRLFNPDIPVIPIVLLIFAALFFRATVWNKSGRCGIWSNDGCMVHDDRYSWVLTGNSTSRYSQIS